MLGNKEIRAAAEDVVTKYFEKKRKIKIQKVVRGEVGYDFRNAEGTIFVEVKGTTASSITEVQFRYFTNGEYNKAIECADTNNKYEVHLVIGIGTEIKHYLIPGETLLKECKKEVSWVLPIRKAHSRFQGI